MTNRITVSLAGPINDLVLAINSYVTTGDRIGEAAALTNSDALIIMVPYDPKHPIDRSDFNRFQSRLKEIAVPHAFVKSDFSNGWFEHYELHVKHRHVRDLTVELLRSSGTADFGRMATKYKNAFTIIRERIMKSA